MSASDPSEFGGGRRKPYTAAGIARLTCARRGCTRRAHATWSVCADANLLRPLCLECDVATNRMALEWMGDPDLDAKMERYVQRILAG